MKQPDMDKYLRMSLRNMLRRGARTACAAHGVDRNLARYGVLETGEWQVADVRFPVRIQLPSQIEQLNSRRNAGI